MLDIGMYAAAGAATRNTTSTNAALNTPASAVCAPA